jgi:dCTP deaminase
VRLWPVLRVYKSSSVQDIALTWYGNRGIGDVDFGGQRWPIMDCAREMETIDVPIPGDGIILAPGILYLASTVEYTETHQHVPYCDGKSSVGRLGIFIHVTAGRGDVGFAGHFTLEISVVQPVRVYASMPIGQLTYHVVAGHVAQRYQTKRGASYLDGRDPMPQPSRLWKKMQASRSSTGIHVHNPSDCYVCGTPNVCNPPGVRPAIREHQTPSGATCSATDRWVDKEAGQ